MIDVGSQNSISVQCLLQSLGTSVQVGLSKGQDWDPQRYLCEGSQKTLWEFGAFESLGPLCIFLSHSKWAKDLHLSHGLCSTQIPTQISVGIMVIKISSLFCIRKFKINQEYWWLYISLLENWLLDCSWHILCENTARNSAFTWEEHRARARVWKATALSVAHVSNCPCLTS